MTSTNKNSQIGLFFSVCTDEKELLLVKPSWGGIIGIYNKNPIIKVEFSRNTKRLV
ncbi:MAG: hypothetical protein UX72_C0052G0006 [Parcubacteria group bacterium GW2011_GWA2_47_10]|nr:MAG: hypothetical protein UX72_C0052G0006 [Parcubacteria group bacterium GW2011_GWA2_47_10]